MFQRFDNAIAKALSSESAQYGASERSIAMAAARRSASENRVKALNEATLGKVGFARMHDTASTRFHEDAEAMAQGQPSIHHPISFYLSTAAAYRKADRRKAGEEAAVAPASAAEAA